MVITMKTVLITGGSRGIGRAISLHFAALGWCVIINYRQSEASAEETRAECIRLGGEACLYRADIGDAGQVKAMVDFAASLHGRLDALINNAAISEIGPFDAIPMEAERRLMEVNLFGAMMAARFALPHMLREHSGSIVNITSMWGEVGASCEVAYSASKAGLIGFTKALAKELAPSGIRVNAVSPGVIDTEMNAHLSKEDRAALADEIPMGRFGRVDEVAGCVGFLCTAASYVTGQILGCSGGMVV